MVSLSWSIADCMAAGGITVDRVPSRNERPFDQEHESKVYNSEEAISQTPLLQVASKL